MGSGTLAVGPGYRGLQSVTSRATPRRTHSRAPQRSRRTDAQTELWFDDADSGRVKRVLDRSDAIQETIMSAALLASQTATSLS
jgi:hypothetical protein